MVCSFQKKKHKASIILSPLFRPEFSPVMMMKGCALNEAPCPKQLFGFKFPPNLKWNLHIKFRKNLTHSTMRCLHRSQIRSKMMYCGCICSVLTFQPWQTSKSFTWPCEWWIIFNHTVPFPQTKCCRPLATLQLFSWQMFRQASFLDSTSSDLSS